MTINENDYLFRCSLAIWFSPSMSCLNLCICTSHFNFLPLLPRIYTLLVDISRSRCVTRASWLTNFLSWESGSESKASLVCCVYTRKMMQSWLGQPFLVMCIITKGKQICEEKRQKQGCLGSKDEGLWPRVLSILQPV